MEDTHSSLSINIEVLPRNTKKAFVYLSRQGWLKKSRWYLAGGTALALSEGHRISLDLDFFIPQKEFVMSRLLQHFSRAIWTTDIAREATVYGRLHDAKVSFIAYPFFSPKVQYLEYGALKILHPRDIAVMKIIAISQRGRKRDFVDLYWYIKKYEPLAEVIQRLPAQYPDVAHNYHHIIKSLLYFDDAEEDPMPEIFFKTDWRQIRSYFQSEVPRTARKILRLD